MAWVPLSRTVPQYEDSNGVPYSGAVLKAYRAGTNTNINLATDSAGGTQVSDVALNSDGYPEVSGNIVLPHVNEKYKLALYPSQSAADSDTGAIWTQDNIAVGQDLASVTQSISTNTVLDSSDNLNQINASGTITITLPDVDVVGSGLIYLIRNSGSGTVTLDGDGSETINGSPSVDLPPSASAIVISGTANWSANIALEQVGLSQMDAIDATTNGKIIGRMSGNGEPQLIDVLDEDDFSADSDTALATQQSIKAYIDSLVIGVGQTWQDVTGSRALNTTYTNNTGRPIQVMITVQTNINDDTDLLIEGSVVARGRSSSPTIFDTLYQAIIPDGNTYRVTVNVGSPSIIDWWELRA